MRKLHASIALALLALLGGNEPAQAATPVLMVLQHFENGKPVSTPVEAKAGAALSPARGRAYDKWLLQTGSALSAPARPADVKVELYRGADKERILVCTIDIRYFRDGRGAWVPHYQLNQDALFMRDSSGRWRPLTDSPAAPSLMVLIGSSLPNMEGYYPSLEFGLSIGSLQIDSWIVR